MRGKSTTIRAGLATFLLAVLSGSAFGAPTCNTPTLHDFSLVQIDSNVYTVGGNPASLDIYSLAVPGINTTCPGYDSPSVVSKNDMFGGFVYGVGYKGSDGNIIAQAGIGSKTTMSTVAEYNVAGAWQFIAQTGPALTPRAQMTANVDPSTNIAYYYGGRTTSNTIVVYNDYYTFDTKSGAWGRPQLTSGWGAPPARYGHSATFVDGRIFILGGIVDPNNAKSIASLDSAQVIDVAESKTVSMDTFGDIPPTIYSYSAVTGYDGHSVVIFGGQNVSASDFDALQNVYVLDTCTLKWSKPNVKGTPPTARLGQASVAYGKYMLVVAGYTNIATDANGNRVPVYDGNNLGILDMDSWTWVDSVPSDYSPPTSNSPGCRFDFPAFPSESESNGTSPKWYDASVITNPNVNKGGSGAKTKGLSIAFSIFAVLLIVGGVLFYLRRQRRKARTLNPRWLPGNHVSNGGKNQNDYPLFVYGAEDQQEKYSDNVQPRQVNMRSYTAAEHAQWERMIGQDQERPEDDRPMSRHMDIWHRMQDLKEEQEKGSSGQEPPVVVTGLSTTTPTTATNATGHMVNV